ncbi:MAG: HD-like signal output (HDOD) protein [Planctomycetota bacterium]|jgi:HD-like signal output (HDOD) protein
MRNLDDMRVVNSPWFEYLTRILESGDHDSDLVLGALSFTPDFALHVLALANSPTFSASTPIERLDRAVFLLGRKTIRDLARNVELSPVDLTDSQSPISWADFVLESVAVATGASLIARAAQIPLVEEARTAGLIHDLGFEVLARENGPKLQEAWDAAKITGTRLVDQERVFCGTDHCEVIEEILGAGGLPDSLTIACGLHHDPLVAPSDHRYLTILLYAGECLAHRAGLQHGKSTRPLLEDRIFAELRLDESVTSSFIPMLLTELERLGLSPRTTTLARV